MLEVNPSYPSKHQKQQRNITDDLDLQHSGDIPSVQFIFPLLSCHYLSNANFGTVSIATLWEYLEVH